VPETDIIDFEIGMRVGVRSGNRWWFGRFVQITATTAVVSLDESTELPNPIRFSRHSRFQIGSKESRYTRPALVSFALAIRQREEYAAATERARQRLAMTS